jgi:hypothetical protein
MMDGHVEIELARGGSNVLERVALGRGGLGGWGLRGAVAECEEFHGGLTGWFR